MSKIGTTNPPPIVRPPKPAPQIVNPNPPKPFRP
jgi:hypothetical protein